MKVSRLAVVTLVYIASAIPVLSQSIVQQNHNLMIQAIKDRDTDEIRKLAATPYVFMNETNMLRLTSNRQSRAETYPPCRPSSTWEPGL